VAVAELNRGATGSEMTGTTIAAAVVHDDTVQWASAGDSAIYLVRGGRLTRLNSTHDYGAVLDGLVAEGKLPLEEAQIHPDRDALTSFVGVPDLSDVDTSARPIPIEKGDRLLLCTDGVYKTLDESEIVRELDGPPQAACERLIAGVAAKERLQQDNATVLMVELQRELAVPQSVASRPAPRATRIGVWKLATFAVIIAVFVTAWLVSSSPVQGTPAPAEMAQKPGDYTGPVAPIEKAAAE
jgi:serine/threonine protein phosphatase PrpC